MKLGMRTWIGILIIAVLISALIGCGKEPKPVSQPKEPMKIGIILPLTGEAAQYGKAFQKGTLLAQSEINANSKSSNNESLDLVFEDSKADPKTAVSAFQKLVGVDKVDMIVGDMFSSTTLAIVPIAQKDGVVLLSPTASAPEVPQTGEYVFTIYPSASYDGKFLGSFMAENLEVSTVAAISVQADAMLTCKEAFIEQATAANKRVIFDDSFAPGTDDFRTVLLKLRNEKPDLVFVAAHLNEISQFVVQAKQLGIRAQFITISTAYDEKLFKLAGDASEGLLLSAPFFDSDSAAEPISRFISAYENQHGTKPNVWAAYGYDAVNISFQAAKHAEQDPLALKDSLLSVSNIPSVTGFTGFKSDGSVEPELRIFVVEGKTFKEFTPE